MIAKFCFTQFFFTALLLFRAICAKTLEQALLDGDSKENIRIFVLHYPASYKADMDTTPSSIFEGGPSIEFTHMGQVVTAMDLNGTNVEAECIHNCPADWRKQKGRQLWQSEAKTNVAAKCDVNAGSNEAAILAVKSKAQNQVKSSMNTSATYYPDGVDVASILGLT